MLFFRQHLVLCAMAAAMAQRLSDSAFASSVQWSISISLCRLDSSPWTVSVFLVRLIEHMIVDLRTV
jgi:hypothetical protein